MIVSRKVLGCDKGLSVAFIGQDGAGKTTITEHICKWLNWKIEAHKFYLGSGDHYHSIYKILKHLFNGKNSFSKKMWAILNVLDLCLLSKHNKRIIDRANKYISKGGIAIFDRYPQIQFPGINDGPKIRVTYLEKTHNSILKMIIGHCAAVEEKNINYTSSKKPDIVIKLLLSPEESIKRKPSENIDDIRNKHKIIKSLLFNNSMVYEIDAEMDFNEELRLIKSIIWTGILNKNESAV